MIALGHFITSLFFPLVDMFLSFLKYVRKYLFMNYLHTDVGKYNSNQMVLFRVKTFYRFYSNILLVN